MSFNHKNVIKPPPKQLKNCFFLILMINKFNLFTWEVCIKQISICQNTYLIPFTINV